MPVPPSSQNGHAHAPYIGPDKLPPQNLECEMGVIGAMLQDSSAIDEVRDVLSPEDFYRDTHQILCRRIFGMRDEGRAVDAFTLDEELRRHDEAEKVGGVDGILAIVNSVPHAAMAVHHAEIVRQHAIGREVIQVSNDVLSAAYSAQHTAEELMETLESKTWEIRLKREQAKAATLVESIAGAYDAAIRALNGEFSGLSTGLNEIDEIVGGLKPGQLIVVGARPSMGKSAMAAQLAEAAVTPSDRNPGGRAVLFCSLEMSREELGTRWLFSRARIDYEAFRRGRPTTRSLDDDIAVLGRVRDASGSFAPLSIDDTPTRTVGRIASSARRFAARCQVAGTPLGLVVVDYIQLIDGEGNRDSRQEQIAKVSRRLKNLARELDVPVVALSQLNRAVELREEHRPRMADLRESGAIEQDSDVILLLHRPEYFDPNDSPGVAEIFVAKNRNGAIGTAKVAFVKRFTRFEPLDPRENPQDF